MSKCRVKVRVEHMQKTFYERLLYVWRQQTEDRNQKFVIYKAYVNLKNYPLEVRTVADLKHIHGIGEALAARCYLAWEAACASSPILDLKIIKDLENEDFIRFIEAAKKSGSIEMRPPTNRTARLSKRSGRMYPEKDGEVMLQNKAPQVSVTSNQVDDIMIKQYSSEEANAEMLSVSDVGDNTYEETHFSVCRPSEKAEVILIADSRENNSISSRDTVVEYLTTSDHRVEMRSLSVGDYLWVLRKIDGTELVLEWIVERKTWNDLHQSIRSGRYEEQKQRLCRSPMKNRVYLVEGPPTTDSSASKQALATTLVTDGFMIQRSKNPQDSAYFLCRLTEYLKTKTARSQVCPGMSSDRAQIVARRFPSFVSMLRFYRQDGASKPDAALSSAVPEINSVLSMQMCKFFTSALSH